MSGVYSLSEAKYCSNPFEVFVFHLYFQLNYPINLDKRTDIGLSDQDLVALGTKELNKKLKRNGITKKRAKELKAERRTLKNRGYAATCR